MSSQQTALAACCHRSVWCPNLIASPHSQARVQLGCLAPLSGQYATKLPRSTLRPMCNQAATIHSQTSVQLDCHAPLSDHWAIKQTRSTSQTSTQLDCHAPLSDQWAIKLALSTLAKTRTATCALWAQLLLLPLPMLLASYWLSSTLRADSFDCSARDWDRIRIT